MNKWLRRLGVGGTRDRLEHDVEELAQGGKFHVKHPDETEAPASLLSSHSADSRIEAETEQRDARVMTLEHDLPDQDDDPEPQQEEDSPIAQHDSIAAAQQDSAVGEQHEGVATEQQQYGTADPEIHANQRPENNTADTETDAAHGEAGHTAPQSRMDAEGQAVTDDHHGAEAGESSAADERDSHQEAVSDGAEPTPTSHAAIEDDSPIARELADLSARRKALEAADVELTGRTRVLTVSNQKGGVGKTTTTVNLAAALAERGARVLVIDLDPQGNASTALGVPHTADTPSVYDVLIDEFPLADIIQESPESPNLLCAPSTIHLAGAEIELVSQVAREHRLRTAVDDYLATAEERVDFILIDCPPSLGLLTINAFTAATELLIPIQCEYYALEGLSQLLGTVRMIQKHLNPRLRLSTIMLTMYDGRTRLAQQVADEVREHFADEVLDTIIPRSVRVSEAPSFGQTVLAYDGQSAGAVAYREAAVEIIRRDSASNEGHA